MDCAPSPTLCALSSHHRLQCSSRLSTLRCMILRIIHWLMAPSMLLVSRFEEFSSPHINILDCTAPPFFCALASRHCLQCSSKLEHLTVRDLTIFSLAAGIFHAARLEVLAFFKCAHRYLGLCTFSHSLCSSFSPLPSMQLMFGALYGA